MGFPVQDKVIQQDSLGCTKKVEEVDGIARATLNHRHFHQR